MTKVIQSEQKAIGLCGLTPPRGSLMRQVGCLFFFCQRSFVRNIQAENGDELAPSLCFLCLLGPIQSLRVQTSSPHCISLGPLHIILISVVIESTKLIIGTLFRLLDGGLVNFHLVLARRGGLGAIRVCSKLAAACSTACIRRRRAGLLELCDVETIDVVSNVMVSIYSYPKAVCKRKEQEENSRMGIITPGHLYAWVELLAHKACKPLLTERKSCFKQLNV